VALAGAMTIYVVHEQSRITRAGYRISRLAAEEVQLAEQIRIHAVTVTRLRQPEVIREQVVNLRLGLRRQEPPVLAAEARRQYASASSGFAR